MHLRDTAGTKLRNPHSPPPGTYRLRDFRSRGQVKARRHGSRCCYRVNPSRSLGVLRAYRVGVLAWRSPRVLRLPQRGEDGRGGRGGPRKSPDFPFSALPSGLDPVSRRAVFGVWGRVHVNRRRFPGEYPGSSEPRWTCCGENSTSDSTSLAPGLLSPPGPPLPGSWGIRAGRCQILTSDMQCNHIRMGYAVSAFARRTRQLLQSPEQGYEHGRGRRPGCTWSLADWHRIVVLFRASTTRLC